MNERKRVAVIGGGIAGIVAADELAKLAHYDVSLFERQPNLGGLNKSYEIDGFVYDIGSFIYSENHATFQTFPFLKQEYVAVKHRPRVIRGRDKIDVHPISFRGYLKNFGFWTLLRSSLSLIYAKIRYLNYQSLPEYCKYYLGKETYEKSGLRDYIQRLYGIDPAEVDLAFGHSRMSSLKHFSLRKILLRRRKKRGDFIFSHTKTQTVHNHFVRPAKGFTKAFELLEDSLKSAQVQVRKSAQIEQIQRLETGFELWVNGQPEYFDQVISSIPLTIISRLLGSPSQVKLKSMNLVSLFYTGRMQIDSDLLYNYSKTGNWKRIIVFSHYYGQKDGLDYFTVEVTTEDIGPESIEKLTQQFEAQAAEMGIASDLVKKGHAITPFAYPVYRKGESHRISHEVGRIQDMGIELIGRQGTFRYLSSHQVVLQTQSDLKAMVDLEVAESSVRIPASVNSIS